MKLLYLKFCLKSPYMPVCTVTALDGETALQDPTLVGESVLMGIELMGIDVYD